MFWKLDANGIILAKIQVSRTFCSNSNHGDGVVFENLLNLLYIKKSMKNRVKLVLGRDSSVKSKLIDNHFVKL